MAEQVKSQKPQLTPEQQAAIATSGQNILVAASAGSGKTKVLVERVIKKIKEDRINISKLLVLTFTEAAAKEMKDRIQQALRDELEQARLAEQQGQHNAHDDVVYFTEQLLALNVANISTIDGFCSRIVKRYYYLLKDLDPGYRMLTGDMETRLLKEEVWDQVREDYYRLPTNPAERESYEAFAKLTRNFINSRNMDDSLTEIVFDLHRFAQVNPNPEAWLDHLKNDYQADVADVTELPQYQEIVKPFLKQQIKVMEQQWQKAKAILDEHDTIKAADHEKLEEGLFTIKTDLIEKLKEALMREAKWDEIRAVFPPKMPTFAPNNKFEEKEIIEKLELIVKEDTKPSITGIIKKLKGEWFNLDNATILAQQKQAQAIVEKLQEVVKRFSLAYQQAKRDKKLLDFSDLEHLSLAILKSEQGHLIKETLTANYAEIMIDEYQDTNALQEEIITQLASIDPGNVFMVGDVKQSIYRFRLADPSLFTDKYEAYAKTDSINKRIILADNFRSSENIVNFTNLLFSQLMDKTVGEIVYDEAAQLKYGAGAYYPKEVNFPVELLAYTGPKEASARKLTKEEKIDAQIQIISQRIKKMLDNKEEVYDKKMGEMRPIKPSDIAIISRTKTNNNRLVTAFKEANIPVVVGEDPTYFETTELQIMLSLLKIIDNPHQDIPLVAVLRSPIVNLDENDLAYLRINHKTGEYFSALTKFAQQTPTDEYAAKMQAKVSYFLEMLESLRKTARQNKLSTLIWEIYQQTGLLDYVGGLRGGEQRQANLHALYERANAYEESSYKGLFQFLKLIESLEGQKNEFTAGVMKSDKEAVQLMTIHGSKGLEFPVVFLFDMNRGFNVQDLDKLAVVDKDYGVGIQMMDLDTRVRDKTLNFKTIAELSLNKLAAEHMRLLYVAITRAEQRLIVVGSYNNFAELTDEWTKSNQDNELILNPIYRRNTKNFMGWIGMCLARTKQIQEKEQFSEVNKQTVFNDTLADFHANFVVNLISEEDLTAAASQTKQTAADWLAEQDSRAGITPAMRQVVKKVLNYHYPHHQLTQTTGYQAVSEIKDLFADPILHELPNCNLTPEAVSLAPDKPNRYMNSSLAKPKFLQGERKVTAAEKGTAMHLLLQKLDIRKKPTFASVKKLLAEQIANNLISPAVAKALDLQMIIDFYNSKLGEKILAHPEALKRETPFSLLYPAKELFAQIKADNPENSDKVLIHGVIDGYLVLDDEVILFDYKTNKLPKRGEANFEEKLAATKAQYEGQLTLYALALESILGRPVTHKYLYLLDNNELVELGE